MIDHKSFFFRFCDSIPPDDFEEELEMINGKLKTYRYNKIKYMQYYLEKTKWIQVFLFLDEEKTRQIEEIEKQVKNIHHKLPKAQKVRRYYHPYRQEIKDFRDIVFKQIKKEIITAYGIIPYFKKRIIYHQSTLSVDSIGTYEYDIILFLEKLYELVIEMERIEFATSPYQTGVREHEDNNILFYEDFPLMRCWLKSVDELIEHFIILKNKALISYHKITSSQNKPVIISDSPYIDAICLFRFWEKHNYMHESKQPSKRIADCFTTKNGKFKTETLRIMRNRMKDYGELDDGPSEHIRIKFIDNILLK